MLIPPAATPLHAEASACRGASSAASDSRHSQGPGGAACLLEASRNGMRPVALAPGLQRTFLCDGDAVRLSAYCQGDGIRVGFGECTGRVLPAWGRG